LTGHGNRVSSLVWNGQTLSSGSRDNTIINFDVGAHTPIVSVYEGWNPEGTQLASGGNDNTGLLLNDGICTETCESNEYSDWTQYIDCHSNCLTCDGSPTTCTSCNTGLLLNDGTCTAIRESNEYSDGTQCIDCNSNCLTCDGSPTTCTSCNTGLLLVWDQSNADRPRYEFTAHQAAVIAIEWCPHQLLSSYFWYRMSSKWW